MGYKNTCLPGSKDEEKYLQYLMNKYSTKKNVSLIYNFEINHNYIIQNILLNSLFLIYSTLEEPTFKKNINKIINL